MPVQLGTRPNPRHCKPVERGPPALGGGIHVNHSMPGDLFQGHSFPKEWKVWPRGEGLAAGWSDLDPQRAALPRPPRDSAMELVLKRSHMEQPQRCDRWTWEGAGRTKSHSRVRWSLGASETAGQLPAPRHRTSGTIGTTDVPAVGQQGGMQGPGPWRTEEGSECAVHVYLLP